MRTAIGIVFGLFALALISLANRILGMRKGEAIGEARGYERGKKEADIQVAAQAYDHGRKDADNWWLGVEQQADQARLKIWEESE